MKKDIQPEIKTVEVTCQSCGNTFKTNTTVDKIVVDVCSNCHPFYTGKLTSNSKAGRVERFNKKFGVKK